MEDKGGFERHGLATILEEKMRSECGRFAGRMDRVSLLADGFGKLVQHEFTGVVGLLGEEEDR